MGTSSAACALGTPSWSGAIHRCDETSAMRSGRPRSSSERCSFEHAERHVAGAGDLARLVEDALEHRLSVELGHQRPAHVEQAAELVVVC
jgi:hypothetical protein